MQQKRTPCICMIITQVPNSTTLLLHQIAICTLLAVLLYIAVAPPAALAQDTTIFAPIITDCSSPLSTHAMLDIRPGDCQEARRDMLQQP
ncbi:hypothetical protein SLEP1_g47175 [Rubroshorea leprosula]|uniref:Secreted protein n=1 Tax=Rubroshorea leprosula TaxID=152421 RepID=A0AAV5LPM3_9ROSI|nr:hypothetical protein SLEP1_g47175 [Rubroshorea leprosula]